MNSHLIIDTNFKYNKTYKRLQDFYYLSIKIKSTSDCDVYVFHYKNKHNALKKLYEMKYNFICEYTCNNFDLFGYNYDEIDDLYDNYIKDNNKFKAYIFQVQLED